LLVFNAKFTFYKRRSNIIIESIKIVATTIEVIRSCFVLKRISAKSLSKSKKIPEIAFKAGKCCRDFLSSYLKMKLPPEKNSIQLKLWPEIERVLEKTNFLKNMPKKTACTVKRPLRRES